MGILQRMFSSDYRRALAAEAQGDYLTAARHFALCGEQARVADMHLAQARVVTDAEERVRCLRLALGFVSPADSRRQMVLRLLGRALRDRAAHRPDQRRALLEEAARLLEEGESWELGGDCWLDLGDRSRAAAAYSKAGLVERVEEVLTAAEQEQRRARQEDSLFQDYQLLLQAGQRDEAAEALQGCIEAAATKGEYRRLAAELEARLLREGRVTLEAESRRVTLIGRSPLTLGRDADCDLPLRGTSLSRRHTRIRLDSAQGFFIADCESRNGTLLNGMRVGGELPLRDAGTITLGESCQLEYSCRPEQPLLLLEVVRGADQGTRVAAGPGPFAVADLLADAPPLQLCFTRGRPLATCPGRELLLNGARSSGVLQLMRLDLLEVEGHQVKVVG